MNLKKNNAMETIDITEKLMNNSEESILIVDDSKFSRKILNDILLEEGFHIITEARNGKEAVELAKEKKPKYVFLDVEMPVLDGLGALPLILEAHPGTNVIMCTAMGQQNIIEEAVREGAKDYILKPYKKESIISIMNAMTVINNRQVIPFDRGKRNQDKAIEAAKTDFNIEEISAVDNLDICKEELEELSKVSDEEVKQLIDSMESEGLEELSDENRENDASAELNENSNVTDFVVPTQEMDPVAKDNKESKEVIVNFTENTDEEVIEGLEAPVEQLIDFIISENEEVLSEEAVEQVAVEQEAEKQEVEKQEVEKQEAEKQEAEKQEAEKQEAIEQDVEKQDIEKQAYVIDEAAEGISSAIGPANNEQSKAEQFQDKLIKVEPLEDEPLKEEQRIEDVLEREQSNKEVVIKEFVSEETIKEGSVEEGTHHEGHISSEAIKKEDYQVENDQEKNDQVEKDQDENDLVENDQLENDQDEKDQEEKPMGFSEEIEEVLPEDIAPTEDVVAKGILAEQEISEEKKVPSEIIFQNEEGSNSSANRFDYLWTDRLENRKRESIDPVFNQNRISSYSIIHSIENNNSQIDLKQSELMLGMTSAYLCFNGRLQPEHYFSARPGLFEQEGIIVFTDSILPRRCKAKAPLTMTEILKLAAKKKQHNANYLSNAIVHLVEGKIDRLLS
jgi:two-component system chemotaxis response regulator CheY